MKLQTPTVLLDTDFNSNTLYVKREDMIPYSFGGNKARKALLFFEEIDRGGYDCILTYGSSHSNHCRIVSNMCAARGLRCEIIGPEEVSEPTFNNALMKMFGAELTMVPVQQVHNTIEAKLAELKGNGMRPYFVPGGGHGNIGTRAFVECYEEIAEFEKANGIHFDNIFFATGTGTTQAGLVCGQLISGDDRIITGISIARKKPYGRDVVLKSVVEYLTEVGITKTDDEIQQAVVFIDDYTGTGYGLSNAVIDDTIRNCMRKYGMPMDSTYTAKAFSGMEHYLREQKIEGKTILFIHTGGTPLFFDDIGRN